MTGPGRHLGQHLDYCGVRTMTERLAEPLTPEDQTVQSMPDVSPTKWHRAHVTWFFETFVLGQHAPRYRVYDDRFGYLFNSYYEAVGQRHARPQRGLASRPTAAEIGHYRRAVDEALLSFQAQDRPAEVTELIQLGLHHEQQHQELLVMDAKHVLWNNPLQPAYGPLPWPTGGAGGPGWQEHEGGIVEIGHRPSGSSREAGFAYDNEGPAHQVLLRPFALANALVTNGDWFEFMADGGYHRVELWMSEGWATRQANDWEAPHYWHLVDGRWMIFTLDGVVAIDPAAPVDHVSWFEADAYARWATARLPLEAE
jgi:ergothioneine biosynthesis protein EgtB